MGSTKTIEIRSRYDNHVIFEHTCANNNIDITVSRAVVQNIPLRGADLCGANLCGADLCDANLCDANLCGADLCDANLRGADLRGADLCGADLCGANLCDANLCGANLCDANLCGADLCDADLCGCVIDYNDYDSYGNVDNLVEQYHDRYGIEITKCYENHDTFSCACGAFWRNLIIIREWKIVERKKKTFNLTEDEKNAIWAFAKLHSITELQYLIRTVGTGYFRLITPNNLVHDLDMPKNLEGLQNGITYKVAELVGDN